MGLLRKALLFCGIIVFVGYIFGKIKFNLNEVAEIKEKRIQNLNSIKNSHNLLEKRRPASVNQEKTIPKEIDNTNISKSTYEEELNADSNSFSNQTPVESNIDEKNQERTNEERGRGVAGFAPQSSGDISNTETASNTLPTKVGSENILGTDTSDFTNVSSSGAGSSVEGGFANGGLTLKEFSCSFDKAEGTYSSDIEVRLNCSESAKIKYCIRTDDFSCDPITASQMYSSVIRLIGNNTYNISYYGESIETGEITEVTSLTYIIDSTPPNLVVNYPKVVLQTSQLPFVNYTYSTDFGRENFYYHQVNLKNHNPTSSGLGWSCSQIFYNYSSLLSPNATVIQNNYSLSGLGTSEKIDQKVDMARLQIGSNYIVTIIENRNAGTFSCQTKNIKINDFFIATFTGTGATPIISGIKKTTGAFGAYGVFQRTPASISAGSQKNEQSEKVLQSTLVDIIY